MTNHLLQKFAGKYFLVLMLVLGVSIHVRAQRWTNVSAIGGANAENGRGVCTDASGNAYYIGIFSGTNIDFDPGPGSAILSSTGSTDAFITKYDADGIFQWAVKCGGTSQDQGLGIATDGTNVYITGRFALSATFGALPPVASNGGTDAFVASLNAATGSFNWAKNIGSANGGEGGHAVCVDGSGGLYVTGHFTTSVTIGTFPLTATGGSGSDLFIAKLVAANGNVTWASGGGSTASSDGLGSTICYHPGTSQVIVGCIYSGTNATYGGFTLTNTGSNDLAMVELNATTGAFDKAFGFGGTTGLDDELNGICYDPVTQDIFLTGFFNGSITFTGTPTLTNTGLGDFYVARYNPATNTFVWSVSGGSSLEERSYSICSNGQGSVYIGGYYSGALSFGTTNLTAVTPAPEVLVAGLAVADGAKQWALSASGNDATLADQAMAVSTGGPAGKIAVCGQFGASATFGTFNFVAAGTNVDVFFAQVAAGMAGTASATNPGCDNGCNGTATANVSGGVKPYSYSWSPGGSSAATATGLCAGTYTVTVTDAVGQTLIRNTPVVFPATSIANEGADNPSVMINAGNNIIANAACRLIAKVVPNGAFPINGPVNAFVRVETGVPIYPAVTGQPFVQRHYQITPASGAATATARVTLYFKQAEFDLFNAHAGAIHKLPMNAGDAAGKANVRFGKYPGNSSDNSGLPGTYTGTVEIIDPLDADIVFNATESRWEISFDAAGFSGFVLQTSLAPLPVTWLEVSAFQDAQQRAQLKWKVQESGVADYVVERSIDGGSFAAIATLGSSGDGEHTYNYTDAAALTGKVYYRIKQNDKNGVATYSQILIISNRQGGTVTVYPNPTKGMVNLNITDRNLMNTMAKLYNSDGRELQQIYIRQTVTQVSLMSYGKGTYFLRLSNGETLRLIRK